MSGLLQLFSTPRIGPSSEPDRLQMRGRGYVVPDSFTHGTSVQRVRWFRKGLQTGDIEQRNTFSAREL